VRRTISSRIYLSLLTASVFPSFLALGLLYYLMSAHDHLVQNHLENLIRSKNPVTGSFLSLIHDKRERYALQAQLLGLQVERRLPPGPFSPQGGPVLRELLERTEEVAEIAIFPPASSRFQKSWMDPGGGRFPVPVFEVNRPVLLTGDFRHLAHVHETPHYDVRILLASPPDDMTNYGNLATNYEESVQILRIYQGIRKYYWTFFFIALCVIVLVSYLAANAFLKSVTRSIQSLAAATRAVAEGRLDVSVEAKTRTEELATLVQDFNGMVKEMSAYRKRIRYLERMGAWQEVARRLAHEIKNPLTPILLAVQQIHEKAPRDNPKYANLVDTAVKMVREEVADLQKLVEAFGSLARLPDKQVQIIPVDEFMHEVVELANVTWGAGSVLLRDVLPAGALIDVDRMLMKRALLNIIENAIHAQKDVGRTEPVACWVTVSRRYLLIHIEDHGPGVPDPELIFEPYYTTKPSGTGLGLPLAKKIILDHEGDVTVRGAGGAGGTLVTVQLPRVTDAKA